MVKKEAERKEIRGRAIPLPGDEIDTDRIIPARFLKVITFEGIGKYAFFDERYNEDGIEKPHPLNDNRFRGGNILLVNKNFGCGSSREHAPQALMNFGIRAFVGESFAEIFAGNCTALGLPAVRVPGETVSALMELVEQDPAAEFVLDIEQKTLTAAGREYPVDLPDSSRKAFLTGAWDSTDVLLARREEIEEKARHLPYLTAFA